MLATYIFACTVDRRELDCQARLRDRCTSSLIFLTVAMEERELPCVVRVLGLELVDISNLEMTQQGDMKETKKLATLSKMSSCNSIISKIDSS